jgi:hypothetical protein
MDGASTQSPEWTRQLFSSSKSIVTRPADELLTKPSGAVGEVPDDQSPNFNDCETIYHYLSVTTECADGDTTLEEIYAYGSDNAGIMLGFKPLT